MIDQSKSLPGFRVVASLDGINGEWNLGTSRKAAISSTLETSYVIRVLLLSYKWP